jgi:KpsF/GutQ family protein
MTDSLRSWVALPENHLLDFARGVLDTEAQAIQQLACRLDGTFIAAHKLLLHCRGRVVVSGMGKSGHIGGKIASTLASTGSPAFFMHPAEASHGDLGMLLAEDVLLALSNSGESEELLAIVPLLKRRGTRVVAMTGNAASRLALLADVHLEVRVEREACPHNLAPTSSTTAVLALGDALALTLLEARGFSAEDFARTHPGGALGRRLLLTVADVMHQHDRVPQVPETATVAEALEEMSRKGLGMTAVVDAQQHLIGVFTDGDLRRALARGGQNLLTAAVASWMTTDPVITRPDELAATAASLMQEKRIFGLFVVENQRLVGAFNMHDLLRRGLV